MMIELQNISFKEFIDQAIEDIRKENASFESHRDDLLQRYPDIKTIGTIIECSKRLPPEKKYVLGYYGDDNWTDEDDQDHVNFIVVKLVRSKVEDNNKLPYKWHEFGPGQFFGQEITHWMPLPDAPIKSELAEIES